jgi:hypothetical protein
MGDSREPWPDPGGPSAARRWSAIAVSALAAVALLVGACSGGADPYDLVNRARTASWDRLEVDVSLALEIRPASGEMPLLPGQPTSIRVPPGSIVLALEPGTGRWRFRLALDEAALGLGPIFPGAGGGAGRLELEAAFDGTSLFARGPLAADYLGMLQALPGGPRPADADAWIRLGTLDEYRALEAAMGALPGGGMGLLGLGLFGLPGAGGPSFALPDPADGEALEAALGAMGVSLSHVGTERLGDVETERVAAAVNLARLLESPAMAPLGPDVLRGVFEGTRDLRVGVDLWFEQDSGRLVEAAFGAATTSNAEGGGQFQLVVAFREPPPDTSFETPEEFMEGNVFSFLAEQLGQSMFGGGGVEEPEIVEPSS